MALGASKPSQKEEFLCHQALSKRLQRNLYFGSKSLDHNSLPLTLMASRVFSGRPGGRLRCLAVREAASVSHQACITPAALVMAMVYLERLAASNADYLQNADPRRLFVASTLAASKYLHDSGEEERVFNDEWAASAELELSELNLAERDFLTAMNWELYVDNAAFEAMLGRLEAAAALSESQRRGWLTYSDLVAVGSQAPLPETIQLLTDALLKVVAVCSVAYLASVLTLFSSVLLVFDAPPSTGPPVFVAQTSTPPPAALLSQLSAAASSGLLLLSALTPLAGLVTSPARSGETQDNAPDAAEDVTTGGGQVDGGDVEQAADEAVESAMDDGRQQREEMWERLLPDLAPDRVARQQNRTARPQTHPGHLLPTQRYPIILSPPSATSTSYPVHRGEPAHHPVQSSNYPGRSHTAGPSGSSNHTVPVLDVGVSQQLPPEINVQPALSRDIPDLLRLLVSHRRLVASNVTCGGCREPESVLRCPGLEALAVCS